MKRSFENLRDDVSYGDACILTTVRLPPKIMESLRREADARHIKLSVLFREKLSR